MALDNTQISNYTDKTTIKNWFKTGLKPTQTQFWSTWDSFWHKDEKLPISSIDNLGGLLDGKAEANHTHTNYVTNDATSLTPQNVTAWQNKLGINDLDYVVIPTEDATVESHPYVVVIDNEGNSARRNATDFGKVDTIDGIEADEDKNVALGALRKSTINKVSDQFSIESENGSSSVTFNGDGYTYFTGNVTYQMINDEVVDIKSGYGVVASKDYSSIEPANKFVYAQRSYVDAMQTKPTHWTNAQQRMSALPDKSADATYNRLIGIDSNGNLSKVDGKTVFVTQPDILTDLEKNSWRQRMNGGYTTKTMSVGVILPLVPINNVEDKVLYVNLLGVNLNLNPTAFSVKITDLAGNTVRDVSLQSNINEANQLVFWFNFKDFPIGVYKVRLTNGISDYLTTVTFEVIDIIPTRTNIIDNNITWEKLVYGLSNVREVSSGSGGQASVTLSHISTGGSGGMVTLKSSKAFDTNNTNLYVVVDFNYTYNSTFETNMPNVTRLGLTKNTNSTPLEGELPSIGFSVTKPAVNNLGKSTMGFNTSQALLNNTLKSIYGKIIISKRGTYVQNMLLLDNDIIVNKPVVHLY